MTGRTARRLALALAAALAAGVAVFLFAPRNGPRILPGDLPEAGVFASGDILLLGSSTWRGRIVKAADGTLFGHVALVDVGEDGAVRLVHASPQRGKTVEEPVETYFAENDTDTALLLGVDAPPGSGERAVAFARDAARRGVPFDGDFSYGSGKGFYCTELALLAWHSAGVDLLPVEKGSSVYPATLEKSPRVRRKTLLKPGR